MGNQPEHSAANRRLEEFMCRFCPPNSKKANTFIGFKVGNTEVLYKKGTTYYQRTRGTPYKVIRFAKTLCPRDLLRKPSYIVCHSTDSPQARDMGALGEKFYFMHVSELEAYLGCPVEAKSGGFVVTLTSPKDGFLDKEISADALKARLKEFLTESVL